MTEAKAILVSHVFHRILAAVATTSAVAAVCAHWPVLLFVGLFVHRLSALARSEKRNTETRKQ